MAATDIYISFDGDTAATEPGYVINSYLGASSGQFEANFLQDDNTNSGVSGSLGAALTASNSGFTGSTVTIEQAILTQMSYHTGLSMTLTLTVPSNWVSCSVTVYNGTTFTDQDALTLNVNGAEVTGVDASNNVGITTFNSVAPDGSDQIVLTITDTQTGSAFIALNGLAITNVVTGGLSGTGSLQAQSSTVSGSGTVTGPNSGTGDLQVQNSVVSGSGTVTTSPLNATPDDFSGTGSLGAPWLTYNPNPAPVNPTRDNGYYKADITTNPGNNTTWFNALEGRYDYQRVRFPTGGTPNEYVWIGVGVGPDTASYRDNLPYVTNSFAFCGPMVHSATLGSQNYMFAVVGHRGSSAQSTVEIKSNVSGTSYVDDESTNVFGSGVTFGDIGVELHNDGSVLFKRRPNSGSGWTYINGGTGLTPAPRPSLGTAGSEVLIGMVTYGFNSESLPFTGSIDAFQVIAQEGSGATGTGTLQAQNSQMAGAGGQVSPITGTGDLQSQDSTISGVGSVLGTVSGTSDLQAQEASISGSGSVLGTIGGSGSLQAQNASMSGVGNSLGTITGTGSLQAQDSQIEGGAPVVISGTGSLVSGPSAIASAPLSTLDIRGFMKMVRITEYYITSG